MTDDERRIRADLGVLMEIYYYDPVVKLTWPWSRGAISWGRAKKLITDQEFREFLEFVLWHLEDES